MRESFVIYKEFYPAIEHFTDEQLGKLFRVIFLFQRDGTEDCEAEIKMAFLFFKNQFRLDEIKYQKTVDRNRNNGSNGGRPPKPTEPTETQPNPNNPVGFQEPKKPDKEKDKDKGNEKENGKEKENDNEKESTSTAKAADPSTFKKMMDFYIDFVKSITGVEPPFSVANQTALSKMEKYFREQVQKKQKLSPGPELEHETVKSWQWVLGHFDRWEPFHQGQLELTQIHKNLINIINRVKNGTPKKPGQTGLTSDQYRQMGEMVEEAIAQHKGGSPVG